MLPDADKTDTREEAEIPLWEIIRFALDHHDWQWAANMCRDGMCLEMSAEEALFVASYLPDSLRLDHGEGTDWHVVREGVCSW